MLLGNKLNFGIQLDPVVPSWVATYPPEKTAWAGLAIWVGGRNLCRHVLPGEERVAEKLFVPLAPIADWIVGSIKRVALEEQARFFRTTRAAHASLRGWGNGLPPSGLELEDWFDHREEWWRRHFWLSRAEGSLLPNLAFVRDGDELVLDWSRPPAAGEFLLEFLCPEGNHSVAWDDGFAVLQEFVGTVRQTLQGGGLDNVYAWVSEAGFQKFNRLSVEDAIYYYTRHSREELQALTGAASTTELLNVLGLSDEQAVEDPAASPATQALRDFRPGTTNVEIGDLLRDVVVRTGRPGQILLRNAREAIRGSYDRQAPPEAQGYQAAVAFRSELGVPAEPIEDVSKVLEQLAVEVLTPGTASRDERTITAARLNGSAVSVLLSCPRTSREWGKRFELARSLGHLLLDPDRSGCIGAASGTFAQETRRRRSGSFAAEFLLPLAALEAASGGHVDVAAESNVFETLMNDYKVGAQTAAWQLWNRGMLSSQSLCSRLIQEYSGSKWDK